MYIQVDTILNRGIYTIPSPINIIVILVGYLKSIN